MSKSEKEGRARLLLRISESLKAKLTALAQREHRSLNRQIEFLLDLSVRSDAENDQPKSEIDKPVRSKRR